MRRVSRPGPGWVRVGAGAGEEVASKVSLEVGMLPSIQPVSLRGGARAPLAGILQEGPDRLIEHGVGAEVDAEAGHEGVDVLGFVSPDQAVGDQLVGGRVEYAADFQVELGRGAVAGVGRGAQPDAAGPGL